MVSWGARVMHTNPQVQITLLLNEVMHIPNAYMVDCSSGVEC